MGGDQLPGPRPELDAFQLAGTGIVVADPAGLILQANRAYCELVGRSEEELLGQPFVHAFPKAFQSLARRALKASLAPDALPMPSYWTLVRGDGRSIAVLLTARMTDSDRRLAVITVTDVTALIATEARLTAVLEEQRLILDHAQVGIVFSRSGRIMRANVACARMFGYDERDLIGRPARVLSPALAAEAQSVESSGPTHVEVSVTRRDGSSFWCEIDGQPFGSPNEPLQAIWTLRDVTARRRAQDKLARLMLDQRALLDNAAVGIAFTRDRVIQRCNRKFEELFGYAPGEVVGKSTIDFYPDEATFAALSAAAAPVLSSGKPFQTEVMTKRKDGSLLWCRLAGKAVDPQANSAGTIWIVDDITAARAAAESSNRLLRELETIFAAATVGIAYTRHRIIQRCSRNFEAMLGYEPGELAGRSTEVLFPDRESWECFSTQALPVIERGETYEGEVPHRRRDGTIILCRVAGRAIDVADLSQGLIWSVQDVTAERAAQEALVSARDELERRVVQRTHDLAQKNIELEVEVTERRQAEQALQEHGERLLYHRNQLMTLARRDRSDLAAALTDILSVACETLRLDRASYWRILADGQSMRCDRVHRAGGTADPAPTLDTITAGEHPEYFRAIVANEVIAAADAASEPATRSLAPVYFHPLGIVASLDVPVGLDGRAVGVVRCEVSRVRSWQPEEIDFASGIATMIALAIEASQRRDAQEKLLRLAHSDSLTGLPNRNLLTDRLRQALAFAARHRLRVALMFLDLDRFKTINDSLGHHIGDQILKEVANRLTRAVRAEDTVARLGGDEFVVLLQELHSATDAAIIATNLLRELTPPCFVDGHELHLSASAGITLYPDDGRDPDVLMKNADIAMYQVKDAGRNGFQFFAATMNQQADRRLEIERDLRLALRRDELVLYYQPQIDLARGEVRVVEALVRWRHPRHGLLLPEAFIGIAEDSGLAQPLAEWTLREACLQSGRWRSAGIAPAPVAVNLSARVFRERAFAASLADILRDTGLPPSLLELEITESAVMQHSDTTLATLGELSAMGIQLAVDDFGTGYSSLAYLKRFPIDKLKIDQSFVRDIPGDANDSAIVQAIISLGRTLDLRVVAEGVETEAQREFLVSHGCDDVQGYLYCRPCDGSEIERIFSVSTEVGARVGMAN
jgi:diguanylate cyclase (GGDEF)-like protein/PAS domain S-box-containing protein